MRIVFSIYTFLIGSIFASFFALIIDRVPKKLSIVSPSSRCDNCGHVLKWYENIPVFSYIFLKGKCSKCGNRIGLFSFVYEIVGSLSLLLVYLKFDLSWLSLFISIITLVLLLIAGYDYKTHYVPDLFLVLLFVACLFLLGYRLLFLDYDFIPYLVSVVLSVLFFVILRLIMTKILKRESLGIGDIYVTGIIAIVLDPIKIVIAMLIASVLGLLIAIIVIVSKKGNRSDEIAFCPYLCFGFYMMLLYGNEIVSWLFLR